MTNQEAFDRVWEHFVVNGGKQSKGFDDTCMYRESLCAEDETRCAVGVLIPDSMYDEGMERHEVPSLIEDGFVGKLFDGLNEDFLVSMQSLHDSAARAKGKSGKWYNGWRIYFPADSGRVFMEFGARGRTFRAYMKDGLTQIAKRFNLTTPDAKATA